MLKEIMLSVIALAFSGYVSAGSFELLKNGKLADIVADEHDFPQVLRAVGDLQGDIESVTGKYPAFRHPTEAKSSFIIIAGSIERSGPVQRLMEAGKLDNAAELSGKWEAYCIQCVEAPFEGVAQALVVAGSDMRGTIYGIYDLSEQIGISPYIWWADVVPLPKSEILLSSPERRSPGPSVKYRGIFINDERNFRNWTEHFQSEESPGQPNPHAYSKVFELLLRLRANTLWPAMHPYSDAFNRYTDAEGVPLNAKLVHTYGIIMGSSHCENMLRNNVGEWERWANANKGHYDAAGKPVYDYTVNPLAVEAYWRERIVKNGAFENIYTLGMRGIHDSGMTFRGLSNPSFKEKTAVLQQIITRQRELLSEVLGQDASEIPQVLIPYKEVADYYNGNADTPGLKVPDDVILMWADDNHGYIRQFPSISEQRRRGGAGVYYHISYWGDPVSYLWVNTTPPGLIREELQRAYANGAKDYWIINVGDIKPSEISLELCMRLAWDIDSIPSDGIPAFFAEIAKRDFHATDSIAQRTANLLCQYYILAIARRPEFFGFENKAQALPFSLIHAGSEGERYRRSWNELFNEGGNIYTTLPKEGQAAFYQMVYYPLAACTQTVEKYIRAQQNTLYLKQGRFRSVNEAALRSKQAHQQILQDITFYNDCLSDGKWRLMMNPYVDGIPKIAQPPKCAILDQNAARPGIGAVCEGQETGEEAVVLQFSSLRPTAGRFLDVFSKNDVPETWHLEVDHPCVRFSQTSGSLGGEGESDTRIHLTIDWEQTNPGKNRATVKVVGQQGVVKTFPLCVNRVNAPASGWEHPETDGYVSIPADAYSAKIDSGACRWERVELVGRNGCAMKVYPDVWPRIDETLTKNSARLEYRILFTSSGTFTGTLYRIPTLNEGSENGVGRSCRIGIGLKGTPPFLLRGERSSATKSAAWKRNVFEQCERLNFTIDIPEPGIHTLVIYQVNAGMMFDWITIDTGGLPLSLFPPPTHKK